MMNRFLFALAGILAVSGCTEADDRAAYDVASAEPAVTFQTADWDVYGDAFEADTAVPVEAVAAAPDMYTDGPVRIVGTITEVCQGMGCWMTLQVPDGRNVRVVMPRDEDGNYVFTLDPAISGRRAVVEGTLARSTLAEYEAPMHADGDMDGDDHHAGGDMDGGDHHAGGDMDGGDHHAGGDMDSPELQLTASGVLVEKVL